MGRQRTFFKPQVDALSAHYRVISVDLRGHGMSDAPDQDYTMPVFADDIAWLCATLGVRKPMLIGHSMGGNVVLELAARHPDVASGIVLIDSLLFAPASLIQQLKGAVAGLQTTDFRMVVRQVAETLFIPSDDRARKEWITDAMERTPQHVLASALARHSTEYDATDALERCSVPAAYIGAAVPLGDVAQLKTRRPDFLISQTLGSGHYSQLEVPDQINAMLLRFMQLCGR
jgi:pimeloyl-ACP methyl ester carboxylesterase